MGQVQSIAQSNSMQVVNNISQISNEKCVNLCVSSVDIDVDIVNSTVGNITLGTYCSVNGASCTLKSALSNTITNVLTSTQKSTEKDEEDPTNFLNTLAEMGESQSIDQSNYQRVVNNVTQQMNSVCMNKDMNSGKAPIHLVNTKAGNISYTANDQVSNTNCVIDNIATNTTNNSLTNSQTASIVKEGMFGSLGFLLIVVALFVLMHHNKKHRQAIEEISRGKIPESFEMSNFPAPSAPPLEQSNFPAPSAPPKQAEIFNYLPDQDVPPRYS